MKVRMRVGISGTRGGHPWPAVGEILEVDASEGAHLCAAGFAEPVADEPAQTATAPAAEKRTASARARGGK